jgi:predicted hotdog family 3-hydroxylacyl-ACP dehydratase
VTTLDRAGIERLVPHSGAMCLLDEVLEWGAETISCRSEAPASGHPLARARVVPAIAAAEYAAQATAVHGALLASDSRPQAGMLAALIEVQLGAQIIDAGDGALAIRADLLSRSSAGCMYSFSVANGRTRIAWGRLMVALQPDGAP